MKTRILNSRLAARGDLRQNDVVDQADSVTQAVDRVIQDYWERLRQLLQTNHGYAGNFHAARALFRNLVPDLLQTVYQELFRMGEWSYHSAAKLLVDTVSEEHLRAVAPVPPELFEAEEPALPPLSDKEKKRRFEAMLFPPPSREFVNRVVFGDTSGATWAQRIQGLSRLASPEVLGNIVAAGVAQGKSQQEIAKDLLPAVQGVRASAKRVARTESMRVAAAMQRAAHAELDDITAGEQIHATKDQRTRPTHRARDGRIWLKDSGESRTEALKLENGQDYVPDAPNCRCSISLILKPPPGIEDDPARLAVFTTNAGKVIPDPVTYSEWFEKRATERQKRQAMGSRKYSRVKKLLGEQPPTWEHFVDEDGLPLSLAQIEHEGPEKRAERLGKVRAMVAERERLIRQTSTFGFLKTEPPRAPTVLTPPEPKPDPLRVVTTSALALRASLKAYQVGKDAVAVLKAQEKRQAAIQKRMQTLATEFDEGTKRLFEIDRELATAVSDAERYHRLKAEEEKLTKRRKALDRQFTKKSVELLGHAEKTRQKLVAAIAPEKKAEVYLHHQPTAGPAVRASAEKAKEFIGQVLGEKARASVNVTVHQLPENQWRAFYTQGGIHLDPANKPEIAAHEIGHHLEEHVPGLHEAVLQFDKLRFGDEQPQQLNKLFPELRYRDDEFGRKDKLEELFGEQSAYYVGKQYQGNSEILSMGLEQLYRDPVRFAKLDREYFNFVVSALRGDFR